MRPLNEWFAPRIDIADVSTVASHDFTVLPERGVLRRVYLMLKVAITVADAIVYMFRGPELAITGAATADGGTSVTFTTGTTAHGLKVGDYVYIKGSADPNYNGIFAVTAVASTTTFKVTTTWTATEGSAEVLRVIGDASVEGDGKITVTQSGCAMGDVFEASPSGVTAILAKGDILGAVSNGGSTTAAGAVVQAVLDR